MLFSPLWPTLILGHRFKDSLYKMPLDKCGLFIFGETGKKNSVDDH